jgi:hypothetical protein
MITITGLTKRQVFLLDKMWSIDSAADYEEWKSGLPLGTMNIVATLEQMVLLAELDEIGDTECDKAMAMLGKFML